MSKNNYLELIIPDLTKLDQLELERQLKDDEVSFEQTMKEGDVHGELVTNVAIVIVSLGVLKILATYLAKKTDGETFSYKVKTRTKDGTEQEVEIKYHSGSSQPPDAEILKQLGEATNVDIKGIGDAFANLD